jgi:RHS repeat-associated protein
VDEDGQPVIQRADYRPYGEAISPTLSPSEGHRFTAHWREYRGTVSGASVLDGLDFMHAREYDWRRGRFLEPDPAGSSWNAYAYVLGNPVKFTDPKGLRAVVGEGWEDQPVNVAMAGSTETAWDSFFSSVPLTPDFLVVARSKENGYYLALAPGEGPVTLDETLNEIEPTKLPLQVWEVAVSRIFGAPGVLPVMKEIFKQAGWGANREERGAFIFLGGGGKLWAKEVAWSASFQKQTIPFTESTLATAHTHPTRTMSQPSPGDRAMGKKANMLMYVLHRRSVTVFIPWINKTLMVRSGKWWR